MRGVVTHHPAQYLRIETYNYTIKQYWVCCLRKKRAGPGCKNGPHPDPYGLGVGTLDQMCGFITPKKRKLKSIDGAVIDKLDADNNNNDDNHNNNSNHNSNNDDNNNNNNNNNNSNHNNNNNNNNDDNNSKNDNSDDDKDDDEDSRIKIINENNNNTSYTNKNADDLRLIDAEEEKKKEISLKFNIIESETSSSDSSINIKSDNVPYNSITSYFFKSLYNNKNTDVEKNIVTYDIKNNLKYNSDFIKTDKMKKKETHSFPVLENTEINEIRSKKKVGFDYDCERKKEYFM